ncbi:MAG: sphingomyelin phosphodiesterase [Saprospiraceae bacterium]|nr:sphingomyelin phosphodiesterase [Saprospiraceae bacterium]
MKYRLFCLLFAALMLITSKPNAQSTSEDTTELKILTWNIQMLPNFFAGASAALRKKQKVRLPWIVNYLKKRNDEVIVFQEVFDKEIKKRLQKELLTTFPYQVEPKTKGAKIGNGILIVSRLPMRYVDHVIYKKGVGSDGMAAKGCTLVEVEKDGKKIHIAGTHLQSSAHDKAQKVRDRQYLTIRKLLDKHKNTDIPQLIMGDMNTRKSHPQRYERMLSSLQAEAPVFQDPRPYTIDSTNSWNPRHPPILLDYILICAYNTNTTLTQQFIIRPQEQFKGKAMDLADHYGVEAVLILAPLTTREEK